MVTAKNAFPLLIYFAVCGGLLVPLFLSTAVFYSVPGSLQNVCFVRSLVVCHIFSFYAFTGLSCCILCFLVWDYFPVTWCGNVPLLFSGGHYDMWFLHCLLFVGLWTCWIMW